MKPSIEKVAIIGAGATGVELAAELQQAFNCDQLLRQLTVPAEAQRAARLIEFDWFACHSYREWVDRYEEIAAKRVGRLRTAGLEKITFAWAGELERGKKHYYRVQGPTFLIEFDNTQNDGNHVHSVWRDFQGDFGRDLLREHLKSSTH